MFLGMVEKDWQSQFQEHTSAYKYGVNGRIFTTPELYLNISHFSTIKFILCE